MNGFFCTECGAETTKWSGKCPSCGAWNSLRETSRVVGKSKSVERQQAIISQDIKPEPITQINPDSHRRKVIGIGEFDGVLGGGIVPGMVVLIGGEPGIGKSTLMLQVSHKMSLQGTVLYISGEESKEQITLRARRLHCSSDSLLLLCTPDVDDIVRFIQQTQPSLVVIDSIQSVFSATIESSPGSVSQLRETTALLVRLAKQLAIPIFLIGHVTKNGAVAGPKIIEHMVDTVLYFEGDNQHQYRILRSTKNRFGSTNEIGIFEMISSGLQEVENASQLFFTRDVRDAGSALGCVLEGTRAFLVEVQTLVSPASYGTSQRVALGMNQRKLALLLAVIEKRMSLNLRNNDVFCNLAGGIKVDEPALDLAIIGAILSSFHGKVIPANTVLLGEVGLSGEVRPVSQLEKRIKEAEKLGFTKIIVSHRTTVERDSVMPIRIIDDLETLLF